MVDLTDIVKNIEETSNNERLHKVTSVSALATAGLVDGQAAELVGYHIGTVTGGGTGVIKAARHNGGTSISLTRSFPNVWGDDSTGAMTAWFADSGADELCFVRTGIEDVYIEMFGAFGDDATECYYSIIKPLGLYPTTRAGAGTFYTSKRILVTTQKSLIGLAPAKQYGSATSIKSDRASIGADNSIVWFGGVSVQSITINNIRFLGDSDIDAGDLANAESEGIYGIDPSGCKQGLDLQGCGYKDLKSGVKRVAGNNYIGFTKLNNSNWNNCYECVDFEATTGVDISGCAFYDNYKVGYLNRIVGDNISINNSTFSAEEAGLTFERGTLSNVWLEGYNSTLHPTEYLKATVGYFSESYSETSSAKFSLFIDNDNVSVDLEGIRIGTNTRLVKFGAGVTDISTISFDINKCINGLHFSSVSDVYTYTRQGLKLSGKNNTQEKYNVDAGGVSIVAGATPVIGQTQLAPLITKKIQFSNQLVFNLDLTEQAFYEDTISSTGYDSIVFNIVGANNGTGGTVAYFGQVVIYNGFGDTWESEILSTEDSAAWTVTLTNKGNRYVTVTIDDSHSGSGNAINPVSATNNFKIEYVSAT